MIIYKKYDDDLVNSNFFLLTETKKNNAFVILIYKDDPFISPIFFLYSLLIATWVLVLKSKYIYIL